LIVEILLRFPLQLLQQVVAEAIDPDRWQRLDVLECVGSDRVVFPENLLVRLLAGCFNGMGW
jgi:hypothetical protein